jgi:Cdc6-like AAA superfamily ATPase
MPLVPEEVFTPTTPVRDDMFATRRHEKIEDRVQQALREPGRQIILYGPTGVGKTSLLRFLCHKNQTPYVRVECGGEFDTMLQDALSKVVTEEVVERVASKSGEFGARVLAGIFGLNLGGQRAEEVKLASVRASLPVLLADALEQAEIEVLFLDNFENLGLQTHASDTRESIVQLLKSLADRAADNSDAVRLAIAGIPEASQELIIADEATARRLAQVEVTRMPQDELDQILERGEEKLGLTFAGLCRDRILQFSDGFPYYTHLLALHSVRQTITDGREEVEIGDFETALEGILLDCDLQLKTAYENAVETTGDVRMRRSIMEAMAQLNDLEVPFRAIRGAFLKLHPEYGSPQKLNFLSTALPALRDKYGIIADKNLPKSKNNFYRFRNPLMRAYVRLRMLRDNPGGTSQMNLSGKVQP